MITDIDLDRTRPRSTEATGTDTMIDRIDDDFDDTKAFGRRR